MYWQAMIGAESAAANFEPGLFIVYNAPFLVAALPFDVVPHVLAATMSTATISHDSETGSLSSRFIFCTSEHSHCSPGVWVWQSNGSHNV